MTDTFGVVDVTRRWRALMGTHRTRGHGQVHDASVGSRGPIDRRGFTLIELMLVVIIISALVAMVAPRLAGRSEEARRGVAEADIKGNLSLALRLYEVDNGRYPSTEQGLAALMAKPTSPPTPKNWKGPYIEQEPLDPWKHPYAYAYPGSHPPRDYDLSSTGPDGVPSKDDVMNWDAAETSTTKR